MQSGSACNWNKLTSYLVVYFFVHQYSEDRIDTGTDFYCNHLLNFNKVDIFVPLINSICLQHWRYHFSKQTGLGIGTTLQLLYLYEVDGSDASPLKRTRIPFVSFFFRIDPLSLQEYSVGKYLSSLISLFLLIAPNDEDLMKPQEYGVFWKVKPLEGEEDTVPFSSLAPACSSHHVRWVVPMTVNS